MMQLHTGRFHTLKQTSLGLRWGATVQVRAQQSRVHTHKYRVKHEVKHVARGAGVRVFCRCVCSLTRGGDEEPGALVSQLSGAFRATPSRGGPPPSPAQGPLPAVEDVPEV